MCCYSALDNGTTTFYPNLFIALESPQHPRIEVRIDESNAAYHFALLSAAIKGMFAAYRSG